MHITNCTTPLVPHWLPSHFVWFRISPAALPTAWTLPNPPSVDVASTRCQAGGWSNKKLFESSNWWSGILKYIEKYHVYVSLCSLFIISYISCVVSSSWSKSSWKLSFTNFVNQSFFLEKPTKALRFATVCKSSGRSGWFGFLQIRSHGGIIGRGQLGRCELWKCAPDRETPVIRRVDFPNHGSEFPAMSCFCLVEVPKRERLLQKCRA